MTLIDTIRSPQRAMYNYDVARERKRLEREQDPSQNRTLRGVGMVGLAMVGVLMLSAESAHFDDDSQGRPTIVETDR